MGVEEHEVVVDGMSLFPEYALVKKAVDRHPGLEEVVAEEVDVHFDSRVKTVAQ